MGGREGGTQRCTYIFFSVQRVTVPVVATIIDHRLFQWGKEELFKIKKINKTVKNEKNVEI